MKESIPRADWPEKVKRELLELAKRYREAEERAAAAERQRIELVRVLTESK